MVYSICHSQPSDQHYLPFSVWSGSSLFAILSKLIRAILFAILYKQYYHVLKCFPLSALWSGSTLFPILSRLIRVYTIVILSLIRVYTVWHSQQSYQGVHYLPYSAVWSRSKLFAILSNLIRVYTICHSQHSDQVVHYLLFSVSPGFTLFAILSSLIRVYTICHSQQSDQGLNCLPFSAVWLGSTLYKILSKQYYQGLHCAIRRLYYLPFSAVWSRSTLFAILSSLIRVYSVRYFQQSHQGLHCLLFSLSRFFKVWVCHSQPSD